jgi:hypothetical protein
MRIAVLIAPSGFRDETVSVVHRQFSKWDVESIITSYSSGECIGSHGAAYTPVINAARLVPGDYDGIFLADGAGVEKFKLYESRQLHDMIRIFNEDRKLIAAVDNAVKIIARANIISGMKVAKPADIESERIAKLFKGVVTENPIEYEGNIATLGRHDKIGEFVDLILKKSGVK